ncbi:MAG: SGNH/GDSL hydrolase family protein [Bacilli bacterium]|nr:SGNH/GDSL hydrolase family protein [Bacilli bacterium]MDD4282333.1 SGNH/GDSL hydrolase family protein [Bacilli bacterium]MDD4718337.1 SGNH/GDSL hydrolase family protein [Bacilli bacterium]
MKLKTILIGSIILLTTFLIYLTTLDKLVYFLALGDSLANGKTPYGESDYGYNDYLRDYIDNKNILEKYINGFIVDDYRITDLVRDIEDNRKIVINNKKQSIKNALIKADLVTLSIGMNELYYKLNTASLENNEIYEHIDEMMEDMDELFNLLRKYCKEDIIIVNYFRSTSLLNHDKIEEYFKYVNTLLKNKSEKYKIHYVEIDKTLEDNTLYLPMTNNYFPSRNGYEAISKDLIKKVDETLLK